jgi:transposase
MALTDHQRRQAFELHATGMSYRKIARQLGCKSDSTIRLLFVPKKPIAPTTPRKMSPKQKSPVTKSVLVFHVRTSSTSVPMRRRFNYDPR